MRKSFRLASIGETFNRTIVELKLLKDFLFAYRGKSFNRTIVELKHRIIPDIDHNLRLLIEPLWN